MAHMKSERGQSLVELAISLVILLYLLSGAVEFGIIFFQYVQLRDAAQEGALYGSMNADQPAKIIERAKYASDKPINLAGDPNVTIDVYIDDNPNDTSHGYHHSTDATNYNANNCEGHGIKVVVGYKHKIFMPFMPKLIGRTEIPLHGIVTDTVLSPFTCTP
jgi:Flp pilus assembly protein TadG